MKIAKKIWDSISNLGITTSLSSSDKKRITLSNQLAFVSAFFTLIYIYIFYRWGILSAISIQVIFFTLYSVVLFISSKGFLKLSKFILILFIFFHLFLLDMYFGENSLIHLLYIPAAAIPLMLYDLKQIRSIISLIGIAMSFFLMLHFYNSSTFIYTLVSPEILNGIQSLFIITTICCETIMIYSLIAINDRTEKQLDHNNNLLQQQLKAIFDNSLDALFLVNWKERKIIKANKRAVELFEAEKESDFYGLYGLEFHKAPKDKVNYEEMRKSLKEKGAFEAEILYKTFKGKEFWGSLAIQIIFISGIPYQSIRVTDITQQKNAKKQLQDSLREKEILLAEIHHRVKNNLAVISSLLGLQSSYIKDIRAKELFEESRNRIHSMALIHDRLYRHETLSRIDFCAYINDLINHIKVSYNSSDTEIKFFITCNDIHLDIKNAVPCGLILNEIISNSCKHAFKGRIAGEIKVVCTTMGEKFTMAVSDNGIGFEEEAIKNSQSLGLKLINELTKQIKGSIITKHDNGTAYYISNEA